VSSISEASRSSRLSFARDSGVPPERNLHGISLAVANLTGFAARAAEVLPSRSFEAVVQGLREGGI
jgi:hypothetical protein